MLTERRAPRVAIFTAIPVEYQAVQAHLKNMQEKIHPQGTIYTQGVFTTPRGFWDVSIIEIGVGNTRAALEGERAVNHLRPDILLFVGVAGGLKDVRIGDVVAATKVHAYEAGRVERDTFYTRPDTARSTYRMEQRARVVARKGEWLSQRIGAVPTQIPTAYVGPMVSGEKLLTSTQSSLWTFLYSHYNDALAIEMEGHGLLSVAHAYSRLDALIIRGISDLIDGKSAADNAHSQEIAACHASAFAFAMLTSLSEDERFNNLASHNNVDEDASSGVFPPSSVQKIDSRQLHAALLHAFPTRSALRTLVSYELKQNLDTIASDSNLDSTIFELLRWAEARGRLEELLLAASRVNQKNPLLAAMLQQTGPDLPASFMTEKQSGSEPQLIREERTMKDHTYGITGDGHLNIPLDVDTGTIFIAREKHMDSFRSLLARWQAVAQSASSVFVDEAPSTNNKIQGPVVFIYGEGGAGKSALLRQYHMQATALAAPIITGNIIDCASQSSRDWLFSPYLADDEIDPCGYLHILCRKLAKSFRKSEEDFAEYRKAKDVINRAEDQVEKVIKKMSVQEPYTFLHRLMRRPLTRKLLQICSGQKSDQLLAQVQALLGQNIDLQEEHFAQFFEITKRKIGMVFDDYLQPVYCLAAALGSDLKRFAEKDPLLVFFDTYEQALAGDPFLRLVMSAAGARVGWIIASRNNLWSGVNKMLESGTTYAYKDIVYHDRALAIDLNTAKSGLFLIEDILTYFAVLCQAYSSLPSLKMAEAESILRATGGLPLAVRIVAEIYTKEHQLDFLLNATGKTEVASEFVSYYFRYVLNVAEELSQLSGLALLRRIHDVPAVIVSLGFDNEHRSNYEKCLIKLHKRYSFLFAEQGQAYLYQNIRHFLRTWLLKNYADLKTERIIKNLQVFYQARISALEEKRCYQNIQQRLEDDEWVEAYLDLAEIYFWLDTHEGILHSLLFLFAAAIYRTNVCYNVIQIGRFFESRMKQPAQKWWDLAARFLYTPPDMSIVEVQVQGLKDLSQWLSEGRFNCSSILASHIQELGVILCWCLGNVYRYNLEQEALDWYLKAFKILPAQSKLQEDILNLYWMMANDRYQQGQYKESLSFLQEALAIKHKFADAYYSLGNVYYALKEYPRAITHYQYAIECDTGHFYAYVNLGNTHFIRKEYTRAIEEYTQAIILDAKDAVIYYNRANAYAALDNYSAALNDFASAIDLDAMLACAYLNRGHVYALQREHKQAMNQYKQAFTLAPENIQIAWTWYWANFTPIPIDKQGIQVLENIASLSETHYVACLCRGIALWIGHREPEAAQRELERAITLAPEEYDPYFWQGLFYAARGRATEANEMLNAALKLGLPPLLLTPLYWLEADQPGFFLTYAKSLLGRYHLKF